MALTCSSYRQPTQLDSANAPKVFALYYDADADADADEVGVSRATV
jgi:hypothetical protein